jgi:glycosyltransferase involved in cell wall biosynthesis
VLRVRVTVANAGAFEAGHRWAAYLQSRNELEALVTALPQQRVARFGLCRDRTHRLVPLGVARYVVARAGSQRLQTQFQVPYSTVFDALASRWLGDCDVFNGWASTSLFSLRAARRQNVPTVLQTGSSHIVYQTSLLEEEFERFGYARQVTHRKIIARVSAEYALADRIVVPSSFVLRTFVEAGVPAEKVIVVREAVEPSGISRGRPGSRPRILFVGRLELRKGIQYLLQAYRQLSSHATLRIVGKPDRELIRRLGGLPAGAEAVGVKRGKALREEYAAADIFVLPSIEDGFGHVVAEAMAAGLAVVVTQNVGAADLIVDGVSGMVVPPRDVPALTDKLGQLIEQPLLRSRLGEAARKAAVGRTWDMYCRDLHALVYQPLLAGARRAKGPIERPRS